MGALIFSFAYGSSLIIMGFIARAFIKKMEVNSSSAEPVKNSENNVKLEKAV